MKINKHYYSWHDIEDMCAKIIVEMHKDKWFPELIVGITRGGNVPATILSNMMDIPCDAIKISLRDHVETNDLNIKNIAEKSYGIFQQGVGVISPNVLIVDDINDTGATFSKIVKKFNNVYKPGGWDHVWENRTTRFAVLTENLDSAFDQVSYSAHEINKAEENVWLVYPWESVGDYNETF